MDAVLIRILTLVAFLLMPFGMSHASAAAPAAPMTAKAAQASQSEHHLGHCNPQPGDDQSEDQGTPMPSSDCSSMCTVIPASETLTPVRIAQLLAPIGHILAAPFGGTEPDISTPPPRRA